MGLVRPLLRGQVYKDHINDPDPHPQYTTDDEVLALIEGNRLIQGYYDQVADEVLGGGALPPASAYNDYEYLVLLVSGAFTTSQPNLAGETGTINDRVISNGGVWYLSTVSAEFLPIGGGTMSGTINMGQNEIKDLPAPTGNNSAVRRRYVTDGDAATLASAEQYADAQDAAHVAAANPHDQYLLETDAVQLFALAAYGGIHYDGAIYPFQNLGFGWEDIDFMATPTIAAPRGITVDAVNSRLAIENAGVYALMASVSFGHNSSNGGRLTRVRLYNHTDGVALGDGFQIGTGRNAEVTSASVSMLIEVPEGSSQDAIGLQIGGGDNYSSVEFYTADFSLHSVGEYRGQLPSEDK